MYSELTQSDLLKIINAQYHPTPKEIQSIARQLFDFRNPEVIHLESIPDGTMLVCGRA